MASAAAASASASASACASASASASASAGVSAVSASGGAVDESLYSRQLYVLGHEAQQRLSQSSVLLSGLSSVGVEVAKNLCLAGVRSLALLDDALVTEADAGSNFCISASHWQHRTSRAAAALPAIAALNPYVAVSVLSGQSELDALQRESFSCVVLVSAPLAVQLQADAYCRQQSVRLVCASACGLFASVFVDVGPQFTLTDPTGEPLRRGLISHISQSSPGVVSCHEEQRHGLQDGDLVRFEEVEGMTALNSPCPPRAVRVLSPFSFSIEDTSAMPAYSGHGGYFQQTQRSIAVSGQSLETQLLAPSLLHEFTVERQLHALWLGLEDWRQQRLGGAELPCPLPPEAVSEVLQLTATRAAQLLPPVQLPASSVSLLSRLARISGCLLAPVCSFIGGVVGQEVLKAVTGKFTPLQQWFVYDGSHALPEVDGSADELSGLPARYLHAAAVFGPAFQRLLASLHYFVVGAGAIGCELLKIVALMGVGRLTVTDMDAIERSNLNRQFLFRSSDVGQLKATVAAREAGRLNPHCRIVSHELRVGPGSEDVYDDGFWASLDACLTGDHRVLTRCGWQSIKHVQVGDEVLSFTIASKELQWKPVLQVQSHAVDRGNAADDLFRMQGSGMDVIATRDHRMLLARIDQASANGLALKKPVVYETVDELLGRAYASCPTSRVSSPHSQSRAVVCSGFNIQPAVRVVIPGLEKVCNWWWQQDEQRGFLHFLGFWLGDGWLGVWHGFVCITQLKEAGRQWLERLLPRVFPRWWRRCADPDEPGRVVYTVRCPPLYAYLRLMAVGPLGYNPRDPQQLRSYPHFTKNEALAVEEQQSRYYQADNSSGWVRTWTEDDMLAAMRGDAASSSPARRSSLSASPARRSSLSAATTEPSSSDDEAADTDADEGEGEDEDEDPQTAAAGAVIRWWNNWQWIIIDGHWFYLKRWLGDQQQIADVYSRLSRQQAVALLDGFCRADGAWKLIQYDDNGEPTGQWRCSNSSFPLIDQLMLIGQLAGAAVDLHLHSKAGQERTIAGRDAAFSCDHWALCFTFTKPARLPMQTALLAQPVDVSDGVAGRGYYQHEDDGRVWCITVEGNTNFLTQRLSITRLHSGDVGVRAHSVFVGNCLTALDNVEARLYLDQRCVYQQRAMIDSGTLGAKGSVQVVIPHLTQSYAASRDPPEESVPLCTLRSFPNRIEHTIQWARDWFEGAFTSPAAAVNAFLLQGVAFIDETRRSKPGELLPTLRLLHAALCQERPRHFADCVRWARVQFELEFAHKISQLLFVFPAEARTAEGLPFWSAAKRQPSPLTFSLDDPLHLSFVCSAAHLRAVHYGLPLPASAAAEEEAVRAAVGSARLPPLQLGAVKIATTDAEVKAMEEKTAAMQDEEDGGQEAEVEALTQQLRGFLQSEASCPSLPAVTALAFDKDDDSNGHLAFVTAASNLRARNYRIREESRHVTKQIAGKIIPAIATTTAAVTGLVCLELYKLAARHLSQRQQSLALYRNSSINLALPLLLTGAEPLPPAVSVARFPAGDWKWTQWDRIEVSEGRDLTLDELLRLLQTRYGVETSMLSYGAAMLYYSFGNKKKMKERGGLSISHLVHTVTGRTLSQHQRFLVLEACVNNAEGDDIDIPFIRYQRLYD